MKNNNQSLTVTILAAAILISGSMVFLGSKMTQGGSQADIEAGIQAYIEKQQAETTKAQAEANKPKFVDGDFTDDDPVLGDPDAPVTIVEWSDFECPFCARFFKNTLPQIKENYIDTGKVKLVYRDYPLGFHDPLATQEAMAANCAREQGDDETYFAYHDLIFNTTTGNGRGLQTEQLYELAGQLDLDTAKFRTCVESEKYKDEIAKDMADGQAAGIRGTPGFLVNGQLVSGAQPAGSYPNSIMWLRPSRKPSIDGPWSRGSIAYRDAPGLSHYMGIGDVNGHRHIRFGRLVRAVLPDGQLKEVVGFFGIRGPLQLFRLNSEVRFQCTQALINGQFRLGLYPGRQGGKNAQTFTL